MWRSLGISCIPILARSKSPALEKWKPFQSRLPSEFELRAWFGRPGYNIAVITGWRGLVIVDFDDMKKHDDWFYNLSQLWAEYICRTHSVRTPRGWHYYFYVTESTQCTKMDGVDTKAGGGYCLIPPSIHPNSTPYISDGAPSSIVCLQSIADILPEYQQAIDRPPPRPQISKLDPLDVVILPHTSTTIEEANAKLSYNQLLGISHDMSPRNEMLPHYLCPLHDDTHASFVVYANGWFCFGCQASGRDKLDLYARLNNLTIREALCTL